MKKSKLQQIATGVREVQRWTCSVGGAADSVKKPLKNNQYTVKEERVKPGDTPAYGSGAEESAEPVTQIPGKTYPVQAVFDDGRGTPLAFDLEKGFSAYAPGSKDQRLFLNGNNTLIVKQEKYSHYMCFHFEKAEETGKYCLYFDEYGDTVYFSVKTKYGTTEKKSQATPFALYDFDSGSKLESLPSESFLPIKTAFMVKHGGQLTDNAIEFGYSYPRLSAYDPGNPYQKFTVCRYDDQLVVFSDSSGLKGEILLTPNNGAADDYLFSVLDFDDAGNEVRVYLGMDENGKVNFLTKKKNEALHFGFADNALPTVRMCGTGKKR